MLDEEGDVPEVEVRPSSSSGGRERMNGQILDTSDEGDLEGLQDLRLSPEVSQEWDEVLAAAGEPWSLEQEDEPGEEEVRMSCP